LILRLVIGLLLAGHGAQKLFGWFGGDGLRGTAGWLASLGLRPAPFWALMAGLSEVGGGILLALGLLTPLGSLGIMASMLMATIKVHWANGLWVDNGGMELPLTNIAAVIAVALTGPGRLSLDAALGIALPAPATLILGSILVLAGVGMALFTQAKEPAPTAQAGHNA
jgi:putative oxidoreductase